MASQLEGVAELTAQLNAIGKGFAAKSLRGTVKEALEVAEHKARANMPQGTEPHKTYRGRLVAPGYALTTLHIETSLNKQTGAAVARLGVGREAFYAVQFVELGTAHTPAQPWLRPAFLESEDEMLRQIGTSMKERIEKGRRSVANRTRRDARRGIL